MNLRQIEFRAQAVRISRKMQEEAAARLRSLLTSQLKRIDQVRVWFRDVNGPKGGADTVCTIQVRVPGRPGLRAECRAEEPRGALHGALRKLRVLLGRSRGKARRFAPAAVPEGAPARLAIP
jgi:putative sigma-54 modulation protein